jgi:hypothetical protein
MLIALIMENHIVEILCVPSNVTTAGMLIALIMGMNMSWTAVALKVLDFNDAQPCLEKA